MPLPESRIRGRAIVSMAPEADAWLGVEVRTGSEHAHSGEVTDVPKGGVGMRFPRARAPQFPVGKQVVLGLSSTRLGKSMELPAVVLARAEGDDFRHYSFKFDSQSAYSREVAKAFYRLFNRRHADRVEPRRREPVAVSIEAFEQRDGRFSLPVHLRNISATGMGIVAGPDADYVLADEDLVRARIKLPSRDTALSLVAWIRSRSLEGDSVAYALRFDPDQSREFCAQQEAIMDYVMGRLVEEIEGKVGKR